LVFLDWITGVFIIALSLYVSLYLCPIFRAGPNALKKVKNVVKNRHKCQIDR
jgi:hypothetical protein